MSFWSLIVLLVLMNGIPSTPAPIPVVNLGARPSFQDDTFYFDKTIPDYETALNVSDFEMASRLLEHKSGEEDDDDWNMDAIYQSDRFEGDIAMDLNITTIQLFVDGALKNGDSFYNAVKNRHQLWPYGIIPYAISGQYSPYSRSVIAAAMQEYTKYTCIRWVPKSDHDINYVYILPDRGCYSMVGKTGGKQVLSLGNGCIHKGVIIHELMHTVGFFHEQSRTDRDQHVFILWHNIAPGMYGQFEKYGHGTIQSLGMAYDYASVMHYGPQAFSRNGLPTIVPIVPDATIGQRIGLSEIDIAKINRLYDCTTNELSSSTTPTPASLPTSTQTSTVTTTTTSDRTASTITTAEPKPGISTTESTSSITTSKKCVNIRSDCSKLDEQGWCKLNPLWMKKYCAKRCKMCEQIPVFIVKLSQLSTTTPCFDRKSFCGDWKMAGFCTGILHNYMRKQCAKSCELC